MDQRLRALGEAIAERMAQEEEMMQRTRMTTLSTNSLTNMQEHRLPQNNHNISFKNSQTQEDPFEMFAGRISILENNLKKTQ